MAPADKYRPIPGIHMRLLAVLGLTLLTGCVSSPLRLDESDWHVYQQCFISPEGRIIDTGNGKVSHSEGQGYGMLFAVAYDDRQTFERIWQWTQTHLHVREDNLFAWQWVPNEQGGAVRDLNNASDGDICIAWALARAGTRWHEPAYLAAATAISRDIRSKLLRSRDQVVLLLPGEHGFEKPTGLTVNLSYWIFPAFAELQQLDPAPEWERLTQTGLQLLKSARFGRWQLPPDWLRVQDPPAIAGEFPSTFGYNAMRIPLYLIWAGRADADTLQPYVDFWIYFDGARFTPAWTNLLDNSVDSYDASPGIHAVMQLTRAAASRSRFQPPQLPPLDSGQDYYSASLLLLSKLAIYQRGTL
jgi:endoglucanase